jgi:hypothetical protein
MGGYAWENLLANPASGTTTLVIGDDDSSGAGRGVLTVYTGTKTNTGTEVDRAGLTNGTLQYLKVGSVALEDRTTGVGMSKNAATPFTLVSSAASATGFLRPEDGAWDPSNPSDYYFVTTDRYDQAKDGVGSQVGRTRLWRASFSDVHNPSAGGNISMVLDGTEAGQMWDNITIDRHGRIVLLEDVGGNAHNGKVFLYDITGQQLTQIAMHDPARFGNIGLAATAPFTNDEEASGVIDAEDILGQGWFLIDTQAHYPLGAGAPNSYEVEGGQLMAMYIPTVVPEPAGLGVLALAAIAALAHRRWK